MESSANQLTSVCLVLTISSNEWTFKLSISKNQFTNITRNVALQLTIIRPVKFGQGTGWTSSITYVVADDYRQNDFVHKIWVFGPFSPFALFKFDILSSIHICINIK